MDRDFALGLAAKIGIDAQQVIREELELIFLQGLFESGFSDRLVFKGGTALRLVYGSARFSEDLDFSLTGKIEFNDFRKIITGIIKSDERLSIKDLASKYYTYLAQIRIKEPWYEAAFPMKIEISKRIIQKDDFRYVNLPVKSPVTNILVMTKVFSLEAIIEDKLRAIKERKMPRDIFDIWFTSQKLNKPFALKNFGYPKGKIRQELRKFLPISFYPVIEDLEKINAQSL